MLYVRFQENANYFINLIIKWKLFLLRCYMKMYGIKGKEEGFETPIKKSNEKMMGTPSTD